MKSKYQNWLVCDVETGGLLSKDKKAVYDVALTEIALVAVNSNLEIVEQASWLIKPYKEGLIYEKGAEKASGISKQMCEEQGMELDLAFKEIKAFVARYKDGSSLPVVVGHNILKFDIFFLMNLFEYFKEDLGKYLCQDVEDTIKWSRYCWVESVNYQLGTCVANAGITLVNAHRALTDTVATAKLLIHFLKGMRGLNSNTKTTNGSTEKHRVSFEL